jgi:hypothetical protein
MGCWSEPTVKDAYRLSWAGLVVEALAAILGIILFQVRILLGAIEVPWRNATLWRFDDSLTYGL